MPKRIIPITRSIYLCDHQFASEKNKHDLFGIFNALRVDQLPYILNRFCLFAQLTNGLGKIPFFADIRFASNNELIRTTQTRQLHFPNRNTVVQLALQIERCPFPNAGLYLIELYCDNTWVGDTTLEVLIG